ncbi:hypothetical protein F5B22DRAFT_22919 [Xylaria bambusicola]|uniref:uncharacterized protein n=1 Tax=Xylaria bambusicola TaxID=326684 RepID=UPI00200831A7|nr:uncharacterized protein F5B22DRAFT_22919 [Xylaria bambusicola]KAI0528135.1 hypothetical protein F5B22DRAFT_22919 [Xylaria bambusicola]
MIVDTSSLFAYKARVTWQQSLGIASTGSDRGVANRTFITALMMSTNMALGGLRRGKHCSYCDRSFARSEHLARHERSHRNKRPYQCTLCDASFSRQDTFKRHQSRHHNRAVGNTQCLRSQGDIDSVLSIPIDPEVARIPSTRTALAAVEDGSEPIITCPPSALYLEDSTLASRPVLDFSTPMHDISFTSDSEQYGNLAGAAHECLDINLGANYLARPCENATTPARPPHIEDSSSWKGSFALSEGKHVDLAFEIGLIAPILCHSEFEIPTRFTFTRLLNAFAECFLIYIPCIHTPTWKAPPELWA